MDNSIRKETPADCCQVKESAPEARGAMDHPTCEGEHLRVQRLRDLPCFAPDPICFQLGLQRPVCSLIRSKAGISLYRVESEGKKLILKVFEKQEGSREIPNYLMLSKLGIPTLPLLGYTENAILLPDVNASADYRLGQESDLNDPQVARVIAKWYRTLHDKGRVFLGDIEEGDFMEEKKSLKGYSLKEHSRKDHSLKEHPMKNHSLKEHIIKENSIKEYFREISMYDESDQITPANMELIAGKTGTADNALWQAVRERYDEIRSRIDALPRTLTYNDFYWTNLIVSKDRGTAFMFDYNLLGKGIACGDVRNVTGALSQEAAEAFLEEYGNAFPEEEKKADAFIAPLVTLSAACECDPFPSWAETSLKELKNGSLLNHLKEWLAA